MSRTMRLVSLLAAVIFLAATPTNVWADYVPVAPAPGAELDHAEIFEAVFSPGTAWVAFGTNEDPYGNPVDLTNGLLEAIRVDDLNLGGVLDVNTGSPGATDDQIWTGGPVTATALARYAGYSQKFGYDRDGDALGYLNLFDVQGNGTSVTGTATLDLDPGETWAWGRSGDGGTWFSDPLRNADSLDHLVTYQLDGFNDGLNHWLLCWEDLNHLGDQDYNDLVIELTAAVPEPGSGMLSFAGLGLLAWLRRRSG
ncbi:MAG: DUF4114 domain-containing protein [Phycisphaerae bacterium]|nr:DUF4114 domain-containing protein [Phycisphaerae bacterium]